MARSTELTVVLLDVGPDMREVLPYATRAVSTFITDKMLYKARHEISIVLYGTDGTKNLLHDEMAFGEDGDASQYTNITMAEDMGPPAEGHLRAVATAEAGSPGTPADFFDALLVALDLFVKTATGRPELATKVHKRIVLVSNFRAAIKDSDDDMLQQHVIPRMQAESILLEVVQLGEQQPTGDMRQEVGGTLAFLDELCAGVHAVRRRLDRPVDLIGCFKTKESNTAGAPTATYMTGPFEISPTCKCDIKLTKKVVTEKLPSLQRYSGKGQAADATHAVIRSTEYRLKSNPEEGLEPGDLVQAYLYGRDQVPLSKEMEEVMQYPAKSPDSGIKLLGFLPRDRVPRADFMKDVWLVAPDKSKGGSKAAFSALVRAMARNRQLAVVRWLARSSISLCVCSPLLGGAAVPDCMLMNTLPMREDLRQYSFASFRQELRPKQFPEPHQLQMARRLLAAFDLTAGGTELLQPEATPNPVLHRFMDALTRRALDPLAPVPAGDPLAEHVLKLPLDSLPAAAEQLRALPGVFCLTREARKVEAVEPDALQLLNVRSNAAAGTESAVDAVGSGDPVGDFQAMVAAGAVERALAGMQAVIISLVELSINERGYSKPIEALKVLREDAVAGSRADSYNTFLRQLAAMFEQDKYKAGFWRLVVAAGITLISQAEVAEGGVPKEQAVHFLQQHSGQPQVKEEQQNHKEAMADDNDMDEMD